MGRTLLILMAGFAASFGMLSLSKNQRFIDSTSRLVDHYARYTSKNAATSGAYMALNQLYLDPAWRDGYSDLTLAGNVINVTVDDVNDDPSLGPYRVRIRASGGNSDTTSQVEVTVFDRGFDRFAVWARDTVINITAKDSLGAVNQNLIIQNAPFMPRIDDNELLARAIAQSHVYPGNLTPSNGYPNGSFYYSGSTPNVTVVKGDLRVENGRTIWGIFSVEGNVILGSGATINGVVYLPQTSSRVIYASGSASESLIKGGVVAWGGLDGSGGSVTVQHFPSYYRRFVSRYAKNNPPMRVISWR
ncbi:MAG: hypothetical protein ONB48_09285 [candidate division KSB1 bacterium]|nr:hypothetical protein [candidate division KSB1 bacterium]MDZ7273680.1 hypothetical protein [candidate division KSB1 bacterium]MDZ7285836.1 hypothetical protein [candidate division KSB1 bacterium]MDZ7298868.1 hypothetical protein [candidate division KSB1 bacterium]MDZ7307086.1 hypothetical protein [candidate division KSB1 bacterium]